MCKVSVVIPNFNGMVYLNDCLDSLRRQTEKDFEILLVDNGSEDGSISYVKEKYPEALVLAHPECNKELLALADYIGSTSGIIDFATESEKKEFIVCTEEGVLYKLQQNNPEKEFYFPSTIPTCPNMKKNTLEKILHVLKTGENEVHVSDALRENSKKPLEKMLELAAK